MKTGVMMKPPIRSHRQKQGVCIMQPTCLRNSAIAVVVSLGLTGPVWAADTASTADADKHLQHTATQMTMTDPQHPMTASEHAKHMQMMKQHGYQRSVQKYTAPAVTLVDQNNQIVDLQAILADPKPLMLDFIYTSCTTICPVLSASFAQVQKVMGPDIDKLRMISITIDPDHDVPAVLHKYAKRFHAGKEWQFLTGNHNDIISVLKSFDAYRGDKSNHIPLSLIRVKPGGEWIRVEGFASAHELVDEYHTLSSMCGASKPAVQAGL